MNWGNQSYRWRATKFKSIPAATDRSARDLAHCRNAYAYTCCQYEAKHDYRYARRPCWFSGNRWRLSQHKSLAALALLQCQGQFGFSLIFLCFLEQFLDIFEITRQFLVFTFNLRCLN